LLQTLSLGVKGASGVTTTIAGLKAVLTNNFVFTADRAVSASATTWSPSLSTWRVDSNFAWKAALRSTGLPATSLPTFPFSDPETRGAAWKYAGGVTRYDQYTRPIETAQSKGSGGGRIMSSVIYGYNGLLPIASVNNANFKECGAFTCDYEKDVIVNGVNYFDFPNGWQKGGGLLTGDGTKHFGERCVKLVDNLGPTRISRIDPTRDYVASAWVKVTGKLLIVAQYCNYTGTDDNIFPIPTNQLSNCDYAQDSKLVESNGGKWQYVELPIKASKKSHTNISKPCIKLMFSNSPSNSPSEIKTLGNIAYMDDLRFYPNDAQATTTYYDATWRMPITTVGVDGKPSQRVVYGGFGRPVRWYKYKVGDHDILQLAKEQEYHLMGPAPHTPSSPYPADGQLLPSNQVTLTWTGGHPDETKQVKYDVYFGTDPSALEKKGTFDSPSYTPTGLSSQKYYWRIVSWVFGDGPITKGPVWWFAAAYEAPVPICVCDEKTGYDNYVFGFKFQTAVNRPVSAELFIDDETTPRAIYDLFCPCTDLARLHQFIQVQANPGGGTWYVIVKDGIGPPVKTSPPKNYHIECQP
jgi:hypothetical protein